MANSCIVSKNCHQRYLPIVRSDRCRILQEAGVVHAGLALNRPEFWFRREGDSRSLLIYTCEGCGYCFLNGNKTYTQPGRVILFPPYCRQAYGIDEGQWHLMWFHLAEETRWARFGTQAEIRTSRIIDELKDVMELFWKECQSELAHAGSACNSLAELILIYLKGEFQSTIAPGDYHICKKFETLWNDVDQKLDMHWTVGSLAQRFCLSPSRFNNLCKRYCELAPMKKVLALRMNKARDLLLYTDLSIKQVGYHVGYDNQLTFSTAFRRHTGVSPSEYRNNEKTPLQSSG